MTDKKETNFLRGDLDAVIEAGKILMESGAEIYRIEETMRYLASALKMEQFEAYVVNRGIIVSGINHRGMREAKVASVPDASIHLDRIEAVNALSREVKQQEQVSSKEILCRLQSICEAPGNPLWMILLAYFIGAGSFSYSIGSPAADAFASAITGLMAGLILHWVERHIRTKILLTVLGSAVVTLTANLLYICGLGQHRGMIILGALMLLIPGAVFINSVREFSQNNYSTGLTLLMSALLTCLSIAAGVALTTELLLFAEQMTGVFSNPVESAWDVILRTVMAGIGTVAFSSVFHAPRRYFVDLGLLGSASWLLYLLLNMRFHAEIPAIFIPALLAALCSRALAIYRKCPMTLFLSTSIFPLIPGLSFYRAVYLFMTGANTLAWNQMRTCFISAFAIAIAISIVQQMKIRPT